MILQFYVDIENSSGTKYGSGPIESATDWEYTARFDVAGTFRFRMLASDPQRAIVQNRRVARAYARIDGVWTEVGAGVIDSVRLAPSANGMVMLEVSGLDLIYELAYRSVGKLKIGEGSGATHAQGVTAIDAFAPDNWTLTAAVSPDHDYIYGRYGGESVLGACCYLAESTQTHFYRGQGRELIFTSQFTDSGIRAIKADGDLSGATCGITSLDQQVDTYDLLTRIYPEGNGQGEAMLTLAATTRVAPAGYTLNAAENYIQHDAAYAEHGLVDFPRVSFKSIGPISNTDADLEAAANMLFDNALHELERRATLAEQRTYTLALTQCGVLLRPLQTIPVIYRDVEQGVDIDEELYILESTWSVSASGIQTTRVVVSTDDRWPDNDESLANEQATKGQVFQAHPQLNANSYVVAYTKNLDQDNDAAFRFRFGLEVTQLQQVLFEFQLLPFESTVRSVGAQTSGSGALSTTVPSTNTSGNPSNNTSGTPSSNTSGSPSNNNSSVPSNNTSGTASGNTGTASGNTGTASGNTGTASGNTGGPSTDETGEPEGGDVISGGQHQHNIAVTLGATVTYPIGYSAAGAAGGFVSTLPGSTHNYVTNQQGDHTHDLNDHTHDLNNHTHSLNNHTHSLNNHTHSLNNHTHSLNNHTHDLSNHTHTLNNHTHDLGNHTHSLNNHTHDLANSIQTFYGIFRDSEDNVHGLAQLEYRVNGGSWLALDDDAEDVDDGWYALDITALVYDSVTFRPLQPNNLLEIRDIIGTLSITSWSASGTDLSVTTSTPHGLTMGETVTISGAATGSGGNEIDGEWLVTGTPTGTQLILQTYTGAVDTGLSGGTVKLTKRTTIDAQLSVRNTIQSIAYL